MAGTLPGGNISAVTCRSMRGLVLEVYDWLVRHSPDAARKPGDVEYPVWVSFTSEAVMLPSPGAVILELTLEPDRITSVNIENGEASSNYSYIQRIRRMPDAIRI